MKKDLKRILEDALKERFYYLPDDNRYAKIGHGYFWINKGKVEQHQPYIDIDFGDIYAKEISEEEFNKALENSKNKVKGYK